MKKDTLYDAIISMSLETCSTIRVKTAGWSMWPLVGDGVVLGIMPDRKGIKQGDIILFRYSGSMVAHRVIKASPCSFTTKGDASSFFDPHVKSQDIIGRALFIERKGRRTCINTGAWRLLNCILAYYSCACGIILGKILKSKAATTAHHSTQCIINILLPLLIYIFTRRL